MAAGKGGSPIIIKRVTAAAAAAGHHGGAWKVAYADFVTAMMAFFLLMWLLNATTEKQRKGLADYFNPTVVANPNGGGQGVGGGDPASSPGQTPGAKTPADSDFDRIARQVNTELSGSGAESMQRVNLLRHVVTRMTDEGLVIELGDFSDEPLFRGETAEPTPAMRELTSVLATILARTRPQLAIGGHVRGFPQMMVDDPAWPLSDARAQVTRALLAESGLGVQRVQRVTAYADRRPRHSNAMDPSNNRIEVILLR